MAGHSRSTRCRSPAPPDTGKRKSARFAGATSTRVTCNWGQVPAYRHARLRHRRRGAQRRCRFAMLTGQGAWLARRIWCMHESVLDDFAAETGRRFSAFRVGDHVRRTDELGPVVSGSSFERVNFFFLYESPRVSEGARIAFGGGAVRHPGTSWSGPCSRESATTCGWRREEIFGPSRASLPFPRRGRGRPHRQRTEVRARRRGGDKQRSTRHRCTETGDGRSVEKRTGADRPSIGGVQAHRIGRSAGKSGELTALNFGFHQARKRSRVRAAIRHGSFRKKDRGSAPPRAALCWKAGRPGR